MCKNAPKILQKKWTAERQQNFCYFFFTWAMKVESRKSSPQTISSGNIKEYRFLNIYFLCEKFLPVDDSGGLKKSSHKLLTATYNTN